MTDTALPITLTLASGVERIFPTLTPAQVQRIAVHGQVRSIRAGEVLFEAGEHVVPFFVVMAGRLEIVLPSGTTERLVTVLGPVSSPAKSTCYRAVPCLPDRAPVRRVK